MTNAPRILATWQSSCPTPPAAAWTRQESPAFNGYVEQARYCAVIPCSIAAAPCAKLTPSGSGTSFSAGTAAYSA